MKKQETTLINVLLIISAVMFCGFLIACLRIAYLGTQLEKKECKTIECAMDNVCKIVVDDNGAIYHDGYCYYKSPKYCEGDSSPNCWAWWDYHYREQIDFAIMKSYEGLTAKAKIKGMEK